MGEEPGADGGKGGGGGTPPAALSADDIKKMVGEQVNGAVIGLLKKGAFKDQMAEVVKASVTETVTTAIKDMMPELIKSIAPPTTTPPGDGKPGGELPPEVKAALAKAESEQKALREMVTTEQDKRKALEETSKKNEERNTIVASLRKMNVSEAHIKSLAPYLHNESGRITRDAEGNVVMSMTREWGTEVVPVEAGIGEWLTKTDEGKAYLPPAGVEGSGVGATGGIPRPGTKLTESQSNQALGAAIMGSFLNGGK